MMKDNFVEQFFLKLDDTCFLKKKKNCFSHNFSLLELFRIENRTKYIEYETKNITTGFLCTL